MTVLRCQGHLYSAGKSTFQPVQVSFENDSLVINSNETGDCIEQVPCGQLKISDKLGNTPRQIELANLDVLSIHSDPQIDHWLANRHQHSTIANLEKSKLVTLFGVILVPLIFYALFKYAVPQIAVQFAAYVPDAIVRIASDHTLLGLDRTLLDPSSLAAEKQANLTENWAATLKQLALSPQDFRLEFRHSDALKANAFALPDGTIVITDELVALIGQDKTLLTAILLHEIGHVEHKHAMRLVAQSISYAIAINYIAGDISDLIDVFVGTSTTLVNNQFSQQLEWEADNYALSQLDKLNLPREAFAQAMTRLMSTVENEGNTSSVTALFSSHPSMRARIDNAIKNPI